MKLAVLGSNESAFTAVEAIHHASEQELVAVWAERIPIAQQVVQRFPDVQLLESWDQLFELRGVEAVVLAGVSDALLTAAEQLAKVGNRILVLVSPQLPPVELFRYTALWQDRPDQFFPLIMCGAADPVTSACQSDDAAKLGEIWKLDFVRSLCGVNNSHLLSSEQMQQWLLQDASWMHTLQPDCTLVTTMATGPGAEQLSEVIVTFSGDSPCTVRWTLKADAQPGWSLTLYGQHGQVEFAESDPEQLQAAELETIRTQLQAIHTQDPKWTWSDLYRLGEIGATANRSLIKKRTLPVHFEEATERTQFKSQMAAIGCGALLWAMFGMIGMLMIGAVADPRDREFKLSSSAGFVIEDDEFAPESAALTPAGKQHLQRVIADWSETTPVLIVETVPQASELNRQRQEAIVRRLVDAKVRDPQSRVVVRDVPSGWYESVMFIGWVLVFLPVFVTLAAQLLVNVSRS